MDSHAVPGSQQALMQVQLEERAAELVVVARAEPLTQLVVVRRRVNPTQPSLHQLPRLLPVVASNPVEEVKAGLVEARWSCLPAFDRVEDQFSIVGQAMPPGRSIMPAAQRSPCAAAMPGR